MSLSDSLINMLNRSPGDVAKEQFKKLYLRLYPYIIGDFHHKKDLDITFAALLKEIEAIKVVLSQHTHITATQGSPTSPTSFFVPPTSPGVVPVDVVARSLEVPGGIPQPTGAGISFQRSKIDIDPIAIPPINPLDPSL